MSIDIISVEVPVEGATYNIVAPATQATIPVEVMVIPVVPFAITGVTLSINGAGAQTLTYNPTKDRWERTLSRVEGNYTLIATATDSSGATLSSLPRHVSVISTAANANAPTITWTQPAAGATLTGPQIQPIVDVQEADGDGILLGSVEVSIDGVTFTDMNGPT